MEDELDDAGAVAQVDEDQAAVVAAAVDPAGDPHLGVDAVGSTWPHQASRYPLGLSAAARASRRLAVAVSGRVARRFSAGHLVDKVGRLDRPLLAGAHVAQLRRAVGLEDQDAAGADPVGVFELALEPAPAEVELGREAGVAQLDRQRHRPLPLARVGDRDEGVAPRPAPPPRPAPAGSARSRPPSRPPASPARRAARSARRSGRRRRSPTGRRARRRRRRRSSACSSRGRGPGSGRARRRCRRRRAAPAPRRSARRPRRRGRRRSSARSPSPPASPRRRSRRRAAG